MPGEGDVPERTFPGASVYNTWQGYRDGVDDLEEVRSGFNISEPSPGNTYYLPPQYKPTPDSGPGDWPSVDSFRDYDGAAGLHPDKPFDHNDGAGPVVIESPLHINDWMGLGTYPDAVAVFLQRLADPTRPWHVDDNPYLTVDSAPIDLTVFNGDGNATEPIDRDGDGTDNEFADNETVFAGGSFDPVMRFDSRRKIPRTDQDRPATVLADYGTGTRRHAIIQRPALSSAFSLLAQNHPSGRSHCVLRPRTGGDVECIPSTSRFGN